MKPHSFEKLENEEMKDIIERCIRLEKIDRPHVKSLLSHDFFADDPGLKIELVSKEESVKSDSHKIEFLLRVIDPKKRSNRYKENEAIQFDFDIQRDNADEVAQEMVINKNNIDYFYCFPKSLLHDEDARKEYILLFCWKFFAFLCLQAKSGLLVDEDIKVVAKMLRTQVAGVVREREERRKNEMQLQQPQQNQPQQMQSQPQQPAPQQSGQQQQRFQIIPQHFDSQHQQVQPQTPQIPSQMDHDHGQLQLDQQSNQPFQQQQHDPHNMQQQQLSDDHRHHQLSQQNSTGSAPTTQLIDMGNNEHSVQAHDQRAMPASSQHGEPNSINQYHENMSGENF